jgi:hypothetical protein
MSKIKDCLFGQIRAVDDNVFRTTDINETAMPTTIPPALVPHVAEQQIITWDNATGMNPLWNKLSHNVMHESYGNMLRQSYNIAEQHGITFISDLIPYKSAAEYDEIIRTDYSSDYALLCASLGFWWHIHLFLQQRDALDYDYTALRQHDTWYYPNLRDEHIVEIFEQNVTNSTMFVTKINTINFPTTAFIQAFFYMFNKTAVKQLQDDFYVLILKEIQHYYDTLGKYAQQIYGKSGVILHNVCVKNDITIIDLDTLIQEIYCWIPVKRSPDCKNYSRLERNVEAVKLEDH